MSISFYSMDAPQVLTDTFDCCTRESCPHCGGTNKVEFYGPAGEVQMSNANAFDVLTALGEPAEYSGGWTADDYPRVLRACMKVLNSSPDAGRPTRETGGEVRVVEREGLPTFERSARVVHQGRPEGYVQTRVRQIQALVTKAQEQGWESVSWG